MGENSRHKGGSKHAVFMNGEAICECVGQPAGVETTVTRRAQSNLEILESTTKEAEPNAEGNGAPYAFGAERRMVRWCVCLTGACGSHSLGIVETLIIKSDLKVRWERLRPCVPVILETNTCQYMHNFHLPGTLDSFGENTYILKQMQIYLF